MAMPSRSRPKRARKSPPAPASRSTTKPATKAAAKRVKFREPVRDKRQAILEAALVLFAERGFHGTAVPEVAAAAGLPSPGLSSCVCPDCR